MKKPINISSQSGWKETEPSLSETIAAFKYPNNKRPKCNCKVKGYCWLPVLFLLFPGCISLYYAPNSQNVPMFKEKNETKASLAFQFGTLTLGCDANLAYSVTHHFGLMANYNHWSAKEKTMMPHTDTEFHITGKSDFAEAGAGYFVSFQEKFVFEVYGGMGLGNVRNIYENRSESKMNYYRYFIQPSCGYYNRKVNLAFSLRISGVDYRKIQFEPGIEFSDQLDLEYIMDEPFALNLEPAFTFRVGGEKLKFQFQVVLSDNLNTPELVYEPFCITTGLMLIIPNKKEKIKVQVE